jgi:hypothetical protein
MFQTGRSEPGTSRESFELRSFLEALFDEYDVDKSGYLGREELQSILVDSQNFLLDSNQITEIMHDFDLDCDGQIEYAEFLPIAAEILSKHIVDLEASMRPKKLKSSKKPDQSLPRSSKVSPLEVSQVAPVEPWLQPTDNVNMQLQSYQSSGGVADVTQHSGSSRIILAKLAQDHSTPNERVRKLFACSHSN